MLTLKIQNGEYVFNGRSMQITKDKNALLAPYDKMIMNYGVVLSILPEENKKSDIHQQIGNARVVHNDYWEQRKAVYEKDKTILTPAKYKKDYLSKLKEDNPFLYKSDKFALEAAIEHVDDAYKRFYDNLKKGKSIKQAGFPKKTNSYINQISLL